MAVEKKNVESGEGALFFNVFVYWSIYRIWRYYLPGSTSFLDVPHLFHSLELLIIYHIFFAISLSLSSF